MKKSKSPIRKILIAIGGFFVVSILIVLAGYLYIAYFLPIPETLTLRPHHLSTKIFDRRGQLLYEVLSPGQGRKTYLTLAEMPKDFVQAVLVSEDSDFYQHIGIDIGSIARAFFYNSLEKRITSGASTITQQLVRNLMGTNRERTFQEKIIETAYAIRLSNLYSKDQVLEQYLNTVYFGNQAYGAGEAALRYFNKNLADLDLAELTMLAGLPQSPSQFNPLVNFDKAKKRQRYVLDRLAQSTPGGFAAPNAVTPAPSLDPLPTSTPSTRSIFTPISSAAADQAFQEELHFATSRVKIEAPHFVQHLLAELEAKYGEDLLYSGLEIQTTIDLDLQKKAEQIIDYQLSRLADKHVTNAALLAADKTSGEILVWVGSQDFFNEQIDGQVDLITALRQPGSALKPFLYLLALENGDTAATIIPDLPFQIKTDTGIYSPLNYDLD
ncbi:transglycosylase domain-containing protein, partial [Candidatus Peregrinibacteria bacterium]|nr:transglycosylase domain-containing protein [Candidatus Peregrinibacteria bacterium]